MDGNVNTVLLEEMRSNNGFSPQQHNILYIYIYILYNKQKFNIWQSLDILDTPLSSLDPVSTTIKAEWIVTADAYISLICSLLLQLYNPAAWLVLASQWITSE